MNLWVSLFIEVINSPNIKLVFFRPSTELPHVRSSTQGTKIFLDFIFVKEFTSKSSPLEIVQLVTDTNIKHDIKFLVVTINYLSN